MAARDTSGERRALSDFADVILNDTEDGVNVVIENRDKVTYVLDFNFSQTQNMTLDVFGGDGAKLTDLMKVSLEVAGGSVRELGDFHLIDDNVTSLCVSYRVRCRIRNPATGKLEKCPTARNQELDVPEIRTKLTPTIDLVAKQAPSGYVCYLENKGGAPTPISVDFGGATNAEVQPLDTRVKQPSELVATIVVPANGTVEFVEVGPKVRGPFKFAAQPAATQPSPATISQKDIPKTVAATTTPDAVASRGPANNKVDNDGFEEHGGGAGGHGGDNDGWDNYEGGSGGFEQHGGGSGGFEQHGGGSGGGSGGNAFTQHGGGAGGFGGGAGGANGKPAAPAASSGNAGPDVSAHGAGGPAAGQNQYVNDDWLVQNFPSVRRDFGAKGAKDASPDCKNWTAYRWVLKQWEDERLARIKLEAEWKVRMSMLIKQWHESVCNICRRLVVDGTATEVVQYKEFRLHKMCYQRADKCDVCGEILVGEYVIAKGTGGNQATKLHNACIDAYRKRSRPSCSICKKQIMEDKWGTANGQPFHFSCKQ